ncbi:RecT family recombinase [Lentibacillus cibarius]|nr:RecT family recombinase [Lentibacillus cibarius]
MEKAIQFTEKEKSLIWSRFIQPVNGSDEEAQHFIEMCENFGLNPLLGDVVFQRYETKRGAKTQFITTRDGLLRVATRQPGYVGPPNANVVKEGDDFEFLPSEGDVKHKFGTKRGKIIGAYAIMKHKKHHPVAVFVDFDEYYNANSGKVNSKYGNPNVWDTLPSAMIVKIAETFVLRRQFPLGGLYTQEEMGLEDNLQGTDNRSGQQPSQTQKGEKEQPKENTPSHEGTPAAKSVTSREMIVQSYAVKTSSSHKQYGLLTVKPKELDQTVNVLVRDKNLMEALKETAEGEVLNLAIYQENSFYFLHDIHTPSSEDKEGSDQQAESSPGEQPSMNADQSIHDTYSTIIQNVTTGEKNGAKFAKIAGEINGESTLMIARGEKEVQQAEQLEQGDQVTLALKKENGFWFLVEVMEDNQQAG